MSRLKPLKRACAVLAVCAATAIALPAQTFTTLHSFDLNDGAYPISALVQAVNGNLYGTTPGGGVQGDGTIFKITPSGTLTTIYNFCSLGGCADGWEPDAALVQATDGNLYGTTSEGGTTGYGSGTVFKITPTGTLTTLYSFCPQGYPCPDAYLVYGGLVQGRDGNFYGTTESGGAYLNYGTVFKITPSGALTTLYSFCALSGCPDGFEHFATLVQGTDGDFYGTTQLGGANSCINGGTNYGCGTIFKITPGGTLTTLYSFCSQNGCTDGSFPYAGLVQAADGDFYGTTQFGGANSDPILCSQGCGTVFKITPSGTLTTLYNFCSQLACADGQYPVAALIQATDGSFYGPTAAGGTNGEGTLFKITGSGTLSTLYSFCPQSGCPDGRNPWAALVQRTNGSFYGAAKQGGTQGLYGTVFSLSVGLGPFIKTNPGFGKTGTVVNILGNNLTGATDVTFNGTPVQFVVVSSSLIRTHVPEGATTGTVQVTTPSGTLSSNVPFRVLP